MEKLKKVLLLNAITSAFTGLLLVSFSGLTAELFGLNTSPINISVGVFLLVYAMFVIYTASKALAHTRVVIILDVAWVVCSAVVLMAYGSKISWVGNLLIMAVALWVGLMAFLQNKFSRHAN
jgi:hypothetical protein